VGWEDLLQPETEVRVLPWLGGREISDRSRVWKIQGKLPEEHGWFSFTVTGGRKATLQSPAEMPAGFETGRTPLRGYLVGNRLIPDKARVETDPAKLIEQTKPVFLVEPGLEHFTRALVVQHGNDQWVYIRQEFPLGPEGAVLAAYLDRKDSVGNIPQVTPALDLAFRWVIHQRVKAEERRKELERIRAEEAKQRVLEGKRQEAMQSLGTGLGRRAMAAMDFETAAKAALAVSGSELLACRPSHNKGEIVVQYRTHNRRLECVVDAKTLRVIDAGVCLDDHLGTKGDTFFTLESLPAVVAEAIRRHKLVVWRHVDGDRPAWDADRDEEDGNDEP